MKKKRRKQKGKKAIPQSIDLSEAKSKIYVTVLVEPK